MVWISNLKFVCFFLGIDSSENNNSSFPIPSPTMPYGPHHFVSLNSAIGNRPSTIYSTRRVSDPSNQSARNDKLLNSNNLQGSYILEQMKVLAAAAIHSRGRGAGGAKDAPPLSVAHRSVNNFFRGNQHPSMVRGIGNSHPMQINTQTSNWITSSQGTHSGNHLVRQPMENGSRSRGRSGSTRNDTCQYCGKVCFS